MKTLLQVLAGEAVWPPPVWLMRQAGRYLPEYRAVRTQAGSFVDLCTTPDLAAEVTLQPIRRFGFDAAILFSDILMLPWALGQDLRFVENEGPRLPPIRDAAGLDRLDPGRVRTALAPVLETIRRVRAGLPETAALIGFAGSPWTVACYMVEGGGSRDQAEIRALCYRDPALMDRLIALLVEHTAAYLAWQIEAGAEAVMLFDSWAGVLPPDLFRRLVIAPTARIVQLVKARHPAIRIIGFPRLAGMMAAAYAAETGVDALGLDTGAHPVMARAAMGDRLPLQGNLDPLALLSGGAAMRDQARRIAESLRGTPHVFNLGHGILPATPPDHVRELIDAVRDV